MNITEVEQPSLSTTLSVTLYMLPTGLKLAARFPERAQEPTIRHNVIMCGTALIALFYGSQANGGALLLRAVRLR